MSAEHSADHEVEKTDKYALLSVFDKRGVSDFARVLTELGYKVISTGGTGKALKEEGIEFTPIEVITGKPEAFKGRMKTISYEIEGGILYKRDDPEDVKDAKKLGTPNIEIVVCNLYPFEQTTGRSGVTFDEAVEQIDVGGPTMVRAAAKNHKDVLVITDPSDYDKISEALKTGSITPEFRQELAAKAFSHLAFYDAQVARYLSKEKFPEEISLPGRFVRELRYGENPHLNGAVYLEPNTNSPLARLAHHGGKELGYVNLFDIAAGIETLRKFKQAAATIIKHNTTSGTALGSVVAEAIERAVEADGESAFGGILVTNRPLDINDVKILSEFSKGRGILMDIVACPWITPDAVKYILELRKDQTGIYSFGEIPQTRSNRRHVKFFEGGFALQDWDDDLGFDSWKTVTEKEPTPDQIKLGQFGWTVIRRIRSNSVIVIDGELPMTRGIGSGQTSRVLSTRIALERAGEHTKRGILVSDSFFPFGDSVKLASQYGIAAIIQQGGSKRDEASIKEANKAGIAMVFTGRRAFWH